MEKEKILKILEDYEYFVDDDYGGHYEHIDCSQRALTPLGIVEILDYISELEKQVKKQKEIIDKTKEYIKNNNVEILKYYDEPNETSSYEVVTVDVLKLLEDKEV